MKKMFEPKIHSRFITLIFFLHLLITTWEYGQTQDPSNKLRQVIHSKKEGEGYVDSEAKNEAIAKAIEEALK